MNEWDDKEITLLTPYNMQRTFKVVGREIEDFAIAHVNLYAADLCDINDPIGEAVVYGHEKLIYKDTRSGEYYLDLVKFEHTMKVYRQDNITLSCNDQITVEIGWDPILQKRFEAFYYKGVL